MLESFVAGAAAALIGVLSGQGLVLAAQHKKSTARLSALEESMPELITRAEVQNAFAQAAAIEARRMAETQQQARQVAVFRDGQPQQPPGLNKQINDQLAALSDRISAINNQFGLG
jgi:hypothetical protein